MIALHDVVLRDDLDPRLGDRDDDLIAQYADIFDALPPAPGMKTVSPARKRAIVISMCQAVVETTGSAAISTCDRFIGFGDQISRGYGYKFSQATVDGVRR